MLNVYKIISIRLNSNLRKKNQLILHPEGCLILFNALFYTKNKSIVLVNHVNAKQDEIHMRNNFRF